MIAAGHATKDIFKTWREALEAEGYSVRLVRHGVIEYEEIQQMIVKKVKNEE
jgi:cobalamin biosynthesis Co2+ chelatase CbiK